MLFLISKRVFVVMVNIAYFHTSTSVNMSIGQLVFFVGLSVTTRLSWKSLIPGNFEKGSLNVLTVTCLFGFTFPFHHQPTKCMPSPGSQQRIIMAWVLERSIPYSVVNNIDACFEWSKFWHTRPCVLWNITVYILNWVRPTSLLNF